MKNKVLILILIILIIATVLGVVYLTLTKENEKEVANAENYKYNEEENNINITNEEQIVKDAVMINGKIYYSTGEKSKNTARCGVMDGRITETVENGKLPTKNNESNFGIDYGYQFVDENTVEVKINNDFIVFKTE